MTAKRGRPPHPDVLTPAEWRVLDAVRHGMTNRQIAIGRGVSLDAVKFHIANLRDKLSLPDRAAIKRWRGIPADSALQRSKPAMTNELSLGPIGQISRVVDDVGKAVEWYRDVLGLSYLFTAPSPVGDLAFFDCGGTRLFLSRPEEGQPTGSSILYFRVDDINAAFDQLSQRGVTFLQAPHMIYKHPDGTEGWMAFFNDMDGKTLALMSEVTS